MSRALFGSKVLIRSSRVTGNLKFSGQQPLYFAAVISLVTLPLPSRN